MDEPSTANTVLDDEKDVVEFLRRRPDFFERNSHLLAELVIPHPTTGQAVSLLERQVAVLREQQSALRNQLGELVAAAKRNQQLQEKFHEFFVDLTSITSVDTLFSELPIRLVDRFGIDFAVIRVSRSALTDSNRPEVLDDDAPGLATTLSRMSAGRTLCDDRLPAEVLSLLFEADASLVSSCALIPLLREADGNPGGVVALGSRDSARYVPACDTSFLDLAGALIDATLARLGTTG
jgi:uncharacterized protein YigA (DUF484 family)